MAGHATSGSEYVESIRTTQGKLRWAGNGLLLLLLLLFPDRGMHAACIFAPIQGL